MVVFMHKGNFSKTEDFLKNASKANAKCAKILKKYAEEGVDALKAYTPVDTGLTASSWGYTIEENGGSLSIYWTNSNVVNNVQIALIIQMGHATRGGTYVQGVDYINPALAPIFEKIADKAWKEVSSR